jgi:hypothetical protein
LLAHAADDLSAGGPTADILAGHLEDSLASGLALRLLSGAHALALAGAAPDLAAYYPSAGGTPEAEPGSPKAWAALRRVLAEQSESVRAWLEHPPQTNEAGRSAALIGGLCFVTAEDSLPIRLVEVGASAGLNLRADHYRVTGDSGSYGDPASPVQLIGGWQGAAPPASTLHVIERAGGDIAPVDPLTAAGRLRLTAYIWPDHSERLARLRGAFAIARRVPVDLRAESASTTVARLHLVPGTWTVLWHSIFRQYLTAAQRAELADGLVDIGAAATAQARFAYLYLEHSRAGGCLVVLTTWPGGCRRVLGAAPAHGMPVRWRAPA